MRRWRTAGPALLAHPVGELPRDGERVSGSSPSAVSYAERGPRAQRALHPARGRGDADPEPVVLAHEEERHAAGAGARSARRVLSAACAVAWFSEASPKLQTTIASRRPRRGTPSAGAVDRERDADRAREVRRDRRGLRDDRELVVAEHLVAAARDRLVRGGGDAEQDVHDPVAAGLRGTREVEAARAVVQQRRVGRPQRQRDDGVALVPGRADRVEGAALLCSHRAA